jgi:hypothetical protein
VVPAVELARCLFTPAILSELWRIRLRQAAAFASARPGEAPADDGEMLYRMTATGARDRASPQFRGGTATP